MTKATILTMLAFGFMANAKANESRAEITDFRQVEMRSFACSTARPGVDQKTVAAEWDAETDVLTAYVDEEDSFEWVAYSYEIYKKFPGLLTNTMLGRPVDGSSGSVQMMLRDQKPSTISLDAKGVSYLSCDILLK